jgi:thiol-disulfide isomerase/thioredoxin
MRLLVFIMALFAAMPSTAEIVDFMLPDLEG